MSFTEMYLNFISTETGGSSATNTEKSSGVAAFKEGCKLSANETNCIYVSCRSTLYKLVENYFQINC